MAKRLKEASCVFLSFAVLCTGFAELVFAAPPAGSYSGNLANFDQASSSFGPEGEGAGGPSTAVPKDVIFQESIQPVLSYQVHILGEVSKPGTYRLAASTRLAEALLFAGGILKGGSERKIELRRKEGNVQLVDLLTFKQRGDLEQNPYLLDNDVIFIPFKKKTVQLEGAVKKRGIYELVNEKTLEDLIKLGGGPASGVSQSVPIKVIRFVDGQKKVIEVENTSRARKGFILENGDVAVLLHFLMENKEFDYNFERLPGDDPLFYPSHESRIFVLGAVTTPGPYPYSPFYKVREYLTVAGGTTRLAKMRKIRVISNDGKKTKVSPEMGLNPGDSILVPEKYLAPENLIQIALTVTSTALSILTAVITLSR